MSKSMPLSPQHQVPENTDTAKPAIEVERELSAVTAQRDALRKALEPFSKLLFDGMSGDDARPIFAINDALITLGDLRKANSALANSATTTDTAKEETQND